MFKGKNSFGRNVKYKQYKNTKKNPQYEENYNEVILNDLVNENNENKVENQDEPARKTKKRKNIKFNLGAKKKSTLNKKIENEQPKEIIKLENQNNSHEIEEEANQKPSKKMKKSSRPKNKKSSKNKIENEQKEKISKKVSKKASKKKSKKVNNEDVSDKKSKIPSKKSKKEDIKTKSIEKVEMVNEEIEEKEVEIDEEEIIEGSVFRNIPEEVEADENEEKEAKYKMENIVWSDNKFPKI